MSSSSSPRICKPLIPSWMGAVGTGFIRAFFNTAAYSPVRVFRPQTRPATESAIKTIPEVCERNVAPLRNFASGMSVILVTLTVVR